MDFSAKDIFIGAEIRVRYETQDAAEASVLNELGLDEVGEFRIVDMDGVTCEFSARLVCWVDEKSARLVVTSLPL